MSRSSVGLITTLLVVSVLAPGAIGGATAQEDPVVVTISLVDSTGSSVGDVDITVSWDGGSKNATTLSDGNAYVEVPDGADIDVEITDEEYIRNRPYEHANASEETIEVPVALSGQATLTFVSESGQPVTDAQVRVRDSFSRVDTLTTDEDGQVTTRRLEQRSGEDAYTLEITKSGFFDLETSLNVTGDVTETITMQRGARTVNVRVVDDHFETPRPIEGAQVRIPQRGFSSRTIGNGETSTNVPVNREYTVQVSKDGYSSAGKRFTVEEQSVNVTVTITRSDDLSILAPNDRVVVGESTRITVTDEYGQPVSNAAVSVGGDTVGRTDVNGQAEVPIDGAGNVSITVADAGQQASVTVEGIDAGTDPTPTPSTPTPSTPTPTPSTPTPSQQTEVTDTTETDTTAGGSGPGFGAVVALVALAGTLLLARRR